MAALNEKEIDPFYKTALLERMRNEGCMGKREQAPLSPPAALVSKFDLECQGQVGRWGEVLAHETNTSLQIKIDQENGQFSVSAASLPYPLGGATPGLGLRPGFGLFKIKRADNVSFVFETVDRQSENPTNALAFGTLSRTDGTLLMVLSGNPMRIVTGSCSVKQQRF